MNNTVPAPMRLVRLPVVRSLARSRMTVFGLAMLILISLGALLGPAITPHNPSQVDILNRLKPPFWQQGGDLDHPLGTDAVGRDVLSRLMHGAGISLVVGISSVVLSGLLGVTLGLVAGFFGGSLGAVIMRIADLQMAFPRILLAIVAIALWGSGVVNLIVVLGVTGWVHYCRVIHGTVLSVREKEYVDAARALGGSNFRIVLHHVLPNTVGPLTVIASFSVGAMILAEATLSFLGLGVPPSIPTWGAMLADGRDYLRDAWWLAALPGLLIMATVLSANLVGDWLRDWLDPHTRSL